MKVQLQEQSLRLRIDEAELSRLLDGSPVDNQTRWPDGRTERQQVALGRGPGWQRDGDGWRLMLDEAQVRDFAQRLPSRDGLSMHLPVPGDEALQVLFDVDVRDSVRHRRGDKAGRL